MLIAWSLALAVNVMDVNGNTEKGLENESRNLSDDIYKAVRQRVKALILAVYGLTVSAVYSFSPFRALNVLAQATAIVLLTYAFVCGLRADADLLSIFHDAALLPLKGSVTVKALQKSSNEQTSPPSRQSDSTLSNRPAELISSMDSFSASSISSMYLNSKIVFISYMIEFGGLFNAAFNFTTIVSGLPIQLQPLLNTFSMIVPISASILLGLSQWSESTAVRGLLESSCTSVWLEMLKRIRAFLFGFFMLNLLIYAFSFYLLPMSLTPSTTAIYILADSLYFGLGLGLLASLAFLLMLLMFFRDFIHLACSREQTQENRG
jgi:hypothetical protein